jgi:hypothetical protein
MLLSAVSVLVIAQPNSGVPEGLMIYPLPVFVVIQTVCTQNWSLLAVVIPYLLLPT